MSKSDDSSTPRRVRVERGIYKTRTGHYEIGWRDATGRLRWRKVDGGLLSARAQLGEEIARRHRGEKITANPKLTFNDAADAWWNGKAMNLRPSTQSAYKSSLVQIRPVFGRRPLRDIEPADIASYVAEQTRSRKAWTVRGELSVISAVFRYAIRHLGHAGANPVGALDRDERPKDDTSPKRILSADELRALVAGIDDTHRLIFEVGVETGGRIGEVLGLTWSAIDFDGAARHFSQQLDRSGNLREQKTARSRRWVEITPGLAAKLKLAHAAAGNPTGESLVFTTRKGTPHDHRNIGGRVLARAVKSAKLEAVERSGVVVIPAPTFHDLRHSHASALIAQGWDIEEVSARLGHADTAITMRTYTHEFDRARRSSDRRRRLAALYAETAEQPEVESTPSSDGLASRPVLRAV